MSFPSQPNEDFFAVNAQDSQAFLASVARAFWEADASGQVIADSPSWQAFTGQTFTEFAGMGWTNAIFRADRHEVIRLWNEAVNQREAFSAEFRIKGPDKGLHWCNMRAVPIASEDGSVKKWLAVFIDMEGGARHIADQKLHQATLDSSMDMIQVFKAVRNELGEIVDFEWILNNHASEKFYGDVIGKSLLRLQPGVVQEGIFDAFKQVVETGVPQQYEKHYVHEQFNGWFHQSVTRLNDGVATTTSDITNLKRAEQELRVAKENLQTTLDSSQYVIQAFQAVRNEAGKIIDFVWAFTNKAWNQLYGEMKGKSLLQENPAVIQTGLFDKFVRVTEDGIIVDHEQYYSHEQFDDQWFHQTLVKMGDGFVMNTEDITRRKKDEAEILRLKDEIAQKATDKYQTIFNSIDEGFCIYELIYNEQGKLVDLEWIEVNPAYERQTGLKDVVGKRHSDLSLDTEDYWYEIYQTVSQTGQPIHFEEWHQPTGRWYRTYITRIGETDTRRVAVIFDDITERKQREEQQKFLLRLSDEFREFTDGMSIKEHAVKMLATHLGLDRCWVSEVFEEEGFSTVSPEQIRPGLSPMSGVFQLSDYPETMRQLMTELMMVEDSANDPRFPESEKSLLASINLCALLVVPLRKGQLRVIWALAGAMSTPRHWTKIEQELLEEVAERTWEAVERAEAAKALAESEEKFRKLFETIDEGFCIQELIFDEDGKAVDLIYRQANEAFEKHTGLAQPNGKRASGVFPHIEKTWFDALMRVYQTGNPERKEGFNIDTGRWLTAQYSRFGGAGSPFIAAVFNDITERRRQDHDQAYLIKLSDALRPLSDPLDIGDQTIRLLRNHLNASRAIYAEALDQQGTMRIIAESVEDGLLPVKGHSGNFPGLMSEAVAEAIQGRPAWCQDIQGDDYSPEQQASYAAYKTRAWLTVPLVKDTKLVAVLTLYHQAPRPWKPEEIQLVQATIERSWLAIERAYAEQQVHESEKRLRIATEAADMATWEWDLMRNQIVWNERHFRIFGLEPTDDPIYPETFFEYVHPADRERVDKLLRESLARDVEFDTEFRAILEDGSERWMSGYGRVMERSGGEPVSMSGVMFDVTARRQAEQDLQHSEARQSAILESAKDYAIIALDLDLRVTHWNAGAEYVLGYSEEEIIGQSGEIFFVPEDRAKGAHEIEKENAIRDGRATNERWHLRKDGSRFYGSGVTRPLLNEAGTIVGLLKVMRDLTHEKRSEDALKEASKRKDEFLAMLAHELRNPLSTVRNGITILKLTQQPDSQLADVVNMMDNHTTHLVRMIDDLLDVSRVTQGKIALKTERLEVSTLISQTVKAIQPQYQRHGKLLHTTALPSGLFVEGDPTRLAQVITNLLTNSLRYTGEDGEVWISLEIENQEALIRVKDNGIGLTAEQQTSVFELFVQGDNSLARSQGGLGVGLTLVKRLVEMHGGKVEARSRGLGLGSEFLVYLPLLDLPKRTEPASRLGTGGKGASLRVLVIDDLEDLARLTSMLLTLKGYQVDICTSGMEGARAVEISKPSIVLCDIGMPGLDGYQTAQLIRQGEWGKQVILIALSGYAQPEDIQKSKEAGFDTHLAKPVDMTELQSVIVEMTSCDRNQRQGL